MSTKFLIITLSIPFPIISVETYIRNYHMLTTQYQDGQY